GLGGLQIDDQGEFNRLLDRKIRRLSALQNPVNVDGGTPQEIRKIYVIGHQATGVGDLGRIRVYRRQSVAGGEFTHSCALSNEYTLGCHHEPFGATKNINEAKESKLVANAKVALRANAVIKTGRKRRVSGATPKLCKN